MPNILHCASLAVIGALVSAGSPPCYSPLNPALETICYSTLKSVGDFSVRLMAQSVNVSLVDGSSDFGDWQEDSNAATSEMFYYFDGTNTANQKIPTTVPMFYRQQGSTLVSSMAIPTSAFPNPAYAPRPAYMDKLEAFPSITIAALAFNTSVLATNLDYSFACGELSQWIRSHGYTPVPGPWSQAWATYSTKSASPHVNECWTQIEA